MTTVLLAGNTTGSQTGHYLYEHLSKYFRVSYLSSSQCLQKGIGEDLLIFESDKISDCELRPCIVILNRPDEIELGNQFDKDTVFILSSEEQDSLKLLFQLNLRTITCGASPKDSVSFSSKNEDEIVISLQRSITNLKGETVEPLEFPLNRSILVDDFTLMVYASILIEIGIIDKNLH